MWVVLIAVISFVAGVIFADNIKTDFKEVDRL